MTNCEIVEDVYNAICQDEDLFGVIRKKFGNDVKVKLHAILQRYTPTRYRQGWFNLFLIDGYIDYIKYEKKSIEREKVVVYKAMLGLDCYGLMLKIDFPITGSEEEYWELVRKKFIYDLVKMNKDKYLEMRNKEKSEDEES